MKLPKKKKKIESIRVSTKILLTLGSALSLVKKCKTTKVAKPTLNKTCEDKGWGSYLNLKRCMYVW